MMESILGANESESQFFNYKNYFSTVLTLSQMQTNVSHQ